MNITTSSIMIIVDGIKILQKFRIEEISLVVPGAYVCLKIF
jgi:hypothetical protein